jgi:enoyl-CoA hydratase/carnithine racemase
MGIRSKDYQQMKRNTDDFFSLRRSLKPTIVKVHGYAVAGGSDIALSCDLVVMAEDARIVRRGSVLEAIPVAELDGAVEALQHGFPAAVRWRDSGRPIPDGGGPIPTTAELDEE